MKVKEIIIPIILLVVLGATIYFIARANNTPQASIQSVQIKDINGNVVDPSKLNLQMH